MVDVTKISLITLKVLFNSCMFFLIFAFAPLLLDVEPNAFNMTLPDSFDGPLRANDRLSQADHLFVNELLGPESLAVWKGDVYTGVSDGRIVRIRKDRYKTVARLGDPKKCINPWDMEQCGRPLGMRFDSKGLLYVIDAYHGLHTVNVTNGKVSRLLTSKKKIGNRKPKFLDDLVLSESKSGNVVIYMTDASKKWDLKHVFFTIGEHDESGRVIRYDPKTKNASVVIKSLGFPNGIELTDDKSALLVCEFNNRRIMKHHIKGQRKGQTDVFSFNLPGEPDNIRRSSDPNMETYWVAFAMGRNTKNPSFVLDHLSNWPKIRKCFMRFMHTVGTVLEYTGKIMHFHLLAELGFKIKTGSFLYHTIAHYGLAVELDADGKIIQSLHSPDGKTTLLSEVREVIVGDRKVLYLGSLGNNYVGKMTLGLLKEIKRPLLTHEKKQFLAGGKPYKPEKSEEFESMNTQTPFNPFDPNYDPSKPPDYGSYFNQNKFKKPNTKKTKKKKEKIVKPTNDTN